MKFLNYCRACKNDFASITCFDQHRVGTHQYTITEGLQMNPPREDGRRCLDISELKQKGWTQNNRGRWRDPKSAARADAFAQDRAGADSRPSVSPGR